MCSNAASLDQNVFTKKIGIRKAKVENVVSIARYYDKP
jgi:hypothetical protein